MTAPRRAAESRGRWAERLAMLWLSCKGYRLLDHRARTAAGEIDLVATRGDYLVFVEVKARRTLTAALESFGDRQRRRIIRAASLWRARHRGFEHLHMRYDLFLVAAGRWPQHRRAAWIPETREALDLL
ncbi:YraN family protein [uncultured Maricaulis sp.]|uniref:YraN family protein n=1 Tax=uncultured Maricaulis sp. TaxID=174710 RepID=UPI0030D86F2B